MAASVLAALATTQVIAGCQNHQPAIEIVVLILDELDHFAFTAAFSHALENERRASPSSSSGRRKSAFEIFVVENIVDVTEAAQRSSFAT